MSPIYLRLVLIFVATFLYCFTGISQDAQIRIKKTGEKIQIDGSLDEDIWKTAGRADNFWQYFPSDSLKAIGPTEILMTYDDQNIYVGVICHTKSNEFVIASLKRDYSFSGVDNLTLLFDTYNDKTNAFVFGMNPYGVRREALIANGGRLRTDFNSSWDNKWKGEAKIYDNYWTAEFAIPFSTIRFNAGSTKWRFNCYRNDTQHNEMSSWSRIPRNYIIMDLSFMGEILWDQPLNKTGSNISLIPYGITSLSRDFDDPEQNSYQLSSDIGGDAKVAVTSGLNLDITVNPDFSQVEVDQQLTDLSRFELFFPEKRQFFIENEDLFGSFGLQRVNPFFSRRIGIEIDPETGVNIQNPILYGLRLSGKLNENFRMGLMNLQTAKLDKSNLPGFNYSVATFQQKVFDRSNISFLFVNKQATNTKDANGNQTYNEYNRVGGIEYRLASADNRWRGKTFYHHVFSPLQKEDKYSHGFQIEYIRRKFRYDWSHLIIGDGFDVEVGFVPRSDYLLLSPEAQIFFYPKNGFINQHSISIDNRLFLELGKADRDFQIGKLKMSERQVEFLWDFRFKNNTMGTITVTDNDLTLLNSFDPTNLQDEGVLLEAGTKFRFVEFNATYTSDQRKRLYFEVTPTLGQFYNGTRTGLAGTVNLRFQPFGSIAMSWDYNRIKLDNPFKPVDIWLVGPKFDFTFSKNVFFTTFVQYNNQFENLNINSRF